MTESFNPEPVLPEVNENDLAQILFEDITDPTHKKRWDHLVETNPTLARVLLEKAHNAVYEEDTSVDLTKRLIDTITFALSAVEAAVARQREAHLSGGRGDEALPPSA
jgi:hypothetical protein